MQTGNLNVPSKDLDLDDLLSENTEKKEIKWNLSKNVVNGEPV